MSRRRPGTLIPLEIEILRAALSMRRDGDATFHGYGLAQRLREDGRSRTLTAHGTLYKALGRMAEAGLLESRWEDPEVAVGEGRPRRRLYRVTPLGATALVRARADAAGDTAPGFRPGLVT